MANLEERVTSLEAHADHHTRAIEGLRADVAGLRSELGQMRGEITQIRGEMATRTELGDLRNEMNRRFDLLHAKIDRLFMWMVGLMVSGFFVVIGGLVAVAFRR